MSYACSEIEREEPGWCEEQAQRAIDHAPPGAYRDRADALTATRIRALSTPHPLSKNANAGREAAPPGAPCS